MKRSLILVGTIAAAASLAAALTAGASASSPPARATVSTGGSSLGRILVDAKGGTLYLFEKDRRGRSACAGTCATYWPPLLTRGRPIANRGARASLLGTIRRPDGKTQVTYAGHPLYRYLPDTRPGQTKGQDSHAFGAGWYVLSSAGKKIEADERGDDATGSALPAYPGYSYQAR
jgi:predicted lipoprotein with Yx(FWY)xxD motif